ncbi:MAG: hypothetical protein J6X28_04065 [Bacilli bacterium]|nr:hypothetical protein [Bacilli bacterium]
MKQIEITTNVLQSLSEVDHVLTNQGFKVIRKSRVEDQYMSMEKEALREDTILDILSRSLIIRYLCLDGKDEYKKLTYKKKVYDGDTVLSEEKINLGIMDTEKARQLLEALGYQKLVDVSYDVTVYQKGTVELCFQEVEELGLLCEWESPNDYTNVSKEEILEEKKRMLQELRDYQLQVSDDYDVKKAYQIIKNRM